MWVPLLGDADARASDLASTQVPLPYRQRDRCLSVLRAPERWWGQIELAGSTTHKSASCLDRVKKR